MISDTHDNLVEGAHRCRVPTGLAPPAVNPGWAGKLWHRHHLPSSTPFRVLEALQVSDLGDITAKKADSGARDFLHFGEWVPREVAR